MIKESEALTFQPYISPVSQMLVKNLRSKSLNNSASNSVDRAYNNIKRNERSSSKNGKENIFLKNMEKVIK